MDAEKLARYQRLAESKLYFPPQVVLDLIEEIEEGDYWQEKATQALENGICPICFASDEAGHKGGCEWGMDEQRADKAEERINQIATAIREGLEEFTDYEMLKTCLKFILKELGAAKGGVYDA